jgi:predicted transcriptional regulator
MECVSVKQLKSSVSELRRLFDEAIPASSIAEAFVSFDDESNALAAVAFMREREFDVVGVRHSGLPVGYILQSEVTHGTLGEHLHDFAEDECLPDRSPLLDALRVIGQHDRAFVRSLGIVTGIITRGDLQKAPVRMWFFNLVSLLEMQMLRLVRECYPQDEKWRTLIGPDRIKGAQRLLRDRQDRNEATDLADCLQFCDKRTIVVKTGDVWKLFGDSRTHAERFLEDVEYLRNDLAHSQDIVTGHWPAVVELAELVEKALVGIEAAEVEGDVLRA